mgnify:CR=1 FL=1
MAFDDQQPPWGKKKGPQTPEEVIALLLGKIKEFFEGGSGGGEKGTAGGGAGRPGPQIPGAGLFANLGRLGLLVGVFFLAALLFSAFYTIAPGETAVNGWVASGGWVAAGVAVGLGAQEASARLTSTSSENSR